MNENKSKNIVIIALCITLIFMGVGFSLLSQTLNINGTASVSGTWNVAFDTNYSVDAVAAKYKGVTVESSDLSKFEQTSGTLSDSDNILGVVSETGTTATFNVLLNEPGDYVVYAVKVKNTGSIDAILDSITVTNTSPTDKTILNDDTEFANRGGTGDGTQIILYNVADPSDYSAIANLGDGASLRASLLATGARTLVKTNGEQVFYVRVDYNDSEDIVLTDAPTNATATGSFTYTFVQGSDNS